VFTPSHSVRIWRTTVLAALSDWATCGGISHSDGGARCHWRSVRTLCRAIENCSQAGALGLDLCFERFIVLGRFSAS